MLLVVIAACLGANDTFTQEYDALLAKARENATFASHYLRKASVDADVIVWPCAAPATPTVPATSVLVFFALTLPPFCILLLPLSQLNQEPAHTIFAARCTALLKKTH
jgi:hypothetical protein